MSHSTIQEIASATNKDTANLLTDIKGIFGDVFPEIHSWNADTRLPDDKITYQILEYYNLKNEINQQLPKGELTTLPEQQLAIGESQNYVVTQLVQNLRLSLADYFGVALTQGVVSAYNSGKNQALQALENIVLSDLSDIDSSVQDCLNTLSTDTKESYQLGEQLRGKLVVASYQRSLNSQALRSNLSSLIAGLKRF